MKNQLAINDNDSIHFLDDAQPNNKKAKRTLSYLDRERQTAKLSKSDKVGFLVTGSILLNGMTLLVVLGMIPLIFAVANKQAPALVQTSDGKTMRVIALEGNQRSPQVLKDTTAVALTKLFTWRNFFTPVTGAELANPKIDPGIEVPTKGAQVGGKIPTEVWQASFALSPELQASYLYVLAKMINDAGISNGAQVSIEILNISNPVSIGEGLWKVSIVANLTRIDRASKVPGRVPFNKDVFLQAVPVPRITEEGTQAQKALSQVMAEAKATGLQIYAMRDSERPELLPGAPASTPASPTPTPAAIKLP